LRERELQRVWEQRLYRAPGLLTEDARPVEVLFPGILNVEGGPDFRGAILRIGGVSVTGDVELHVTTDGCRGHGHCWDGAYESVVLHVALERGRTCAPSGVAELVLGPRVESHPKGPTLGPIDDEELDRLGDLRFDRRIARLRRDLAREWPARLFYREILIGLGYKSNRAGFEELARLIPLERLQGRSIPEMERVLVDAARSIPWRTRGVRPANRPMRRISSIARWLGRVGTEAPHAPHLARPLDTSFDPGGIGADRERQLIANVVLPLAAAMGDAEARQIFAQLPGAPQNRRVRDARALFGVARVGSLRREWGMLELVGKFGLAPSSGSVLHSAFGVPRERGERDPGAV